MTQPDRGTAELTVLMGDVLAARIRRDATARLSLAYEPGWLARDDAFPLSLSLPLATDDHRHEVVDAFLAGLLPDNPSVLERLARRFHASARSPFGLLVHVGEDCAGAIRLVAPDRLEDVMGETAEERIAWLSDEEVAQRLRALRADASAWRMQDDPGQFSLAGAQAKTALHFRDGRFGVPGGRTPTTHLLKPPLPDFPGHVENEHASLALARAVGLPAARSEVRRFGDEIALVVERYDRVARDGRVLRIHQEDACQALGVQPALRYEADRGPSAAALAHLLTRHSTRPAEDVRTFVGALAFHWITGGTDAHAKNYSFLHQPGGIRLAPLYDLASALPYPDLDTRRLRLAMRIGSKYRLDAVRRTDWEALAGDVGRPGEEVLASVIELAERIPPSLRGVIHAMREAGTTHPVLDRLVQAVTDRAHRCLRKLEAR